MRSKQGRLMRKKLGTLRHSAEASIGIAAGKALDILDELPGLFVSGFSLPGLVCDLLHHGLLLSLNDNLLLYRYWSKSQSVPFSPKIYTPHRNGFSRNVSK